MFHLRSKNTVKQTVKGLFTIVRPIQYEVRVPSHDWSAFFGKYDNQKWGLWDSNSCWKLSQVNCLEDQMEWLWKNEGLRQLVHQADEFIADFFSKNEITQEMYALGQQFLKYVSVSYQKIGAQQWSTPPREILLAALKQAPLQLSIPVPQIPGVWNNTYIKYDGRKATDHAVECYDIGGDGSYKIFDQYLPNLKTLSPDYLIPKVTQGIVEAIDPAAPNPIPQDAFWNKFWQGVIHFFNNIFDAEVPIGKVV